MRLPRKNISRVEPLNRGCSRSAGVPACEFTGRPAPCSFARRDAARTRSRDGCVTRFMGRIAAILEGRIVFHSVSGVQLFSAGGRIFPLLIEDRRVGGQGNDYERAAGALMAGV